MKKVLLLESLGADYGSYFVDRGFVDLVGADNIRSWPYKYTHNGDFDRYPERCHPDGSGRVIHVAAGKMAYVPAFTGCELWAHEALWRGWKPEKLPEAYVPRDAPTHFGVPLGIPFAEDDDILGMVERGDFGLIVLNGARWHGSAALHELRARFGDRLPPIAFCDHDDYPQRRWDFVEAFKPAVYFKRSMLIGGHPLDFMFGVRRDVVMRPLPFSSAWAAPFVPHRDRDIDVFCVFGNTQVMRKKIKEAAEEEARAAFPAAKVVSAIGHPLEYPEYRAMMARSRVVIDQQGAGTDTLRFWEAASVGACVISDFNLHQPAPALDPMEHFYRYPNDLSQAGDQQDLTVFRNWVRAAVLDSERAERVGRAMYNRVAEFHTARARAKWIVSEMRGQGHALAGLP